jgi:siderophore ferric iron reductase
MMDKPADLATVLSRTADMLPMLRATLVAEQIRQPEEEIARLYQAIVAASPHAGKVYWSSRTWQVWSWQATYMQVIASHLYGVVLDTTSFMPCIVGEHANGFELVSHTVVMHEPNDAIAGAQTACLDWIERYTPMIAVYGAFNGKLARQYTADSMLGALLYLQSQSLLSQDEVLRLGPIWTAAMGLAKASYLSCETIPQPHIMLNNALCCQHYRRDKENLCVGCPRRKNPKGQEAEDSTLT